jgi:hypothetical protein
VIKEGFMLKNFLVILVACLLVSTSRADEPNFKVVSASVPAKLFSLTEATPVQPRIFTLPVLSTPAEQPAKEVTVPAEVIVQGATRVVHQSVSYPAYQPISTPVYHAPVYQQAYPQAYTQPVYQQPVYQQPGYTAPSYGNCISGVCTPRG